MSMLDTLMDISEAETGTMRLSYEDVDVSALVGEVAELYHDVAEDKQIRITTRVPQTLLLRGDRSRLRQVLANLVDNAVKYTPSAGSVAIEACEDAENIIVRVKDKGAGITPVELPQVWDRLYRGDQSRSQRGLGLGLSLVRAVVHAHHGRVEVASEPGRGSVFSVYLPRSPVR
jgi:signal transduction histidine kinase